jgi:hypothetical protein
MLRVWTLNLTKVRLETIKMCKFQRNIFAKLIRSGLNATKKKHRIGARKCCLEYA